MLAGAVGSGAGEEAGGVTEREESLSLRMLMPSLWGLGMGAEG